MGRRRNILYKVIIGACVFLLSLSATFILLYLYMPQRLSTAEPVSTIQVPVSTPRPAASYAPPLQININKINVSTQIIPTGLTVNGDMDISDDAERVAWYQLGAKPGEVGSAVIAGHYGWKNRVPSVFNDLHKLVVGDQISIEKQDGTTETFVVHRMETYQPEQDATEVFTSKDGKAHLNLITCQGVWNRGQATYSERLVVFTESTKNQ